MLWSYTVHRKCASPDVSWENIELDSKQPIADLMQLFSEMYRTSLKTGPLKLYPFSLIALNFGELDSKDHITHHHNSLPYLQVEFKSLHAESTVDGNHSARVPLRYINAPQTLHLSVELVLENLFRPLFLVSTVSHQMHVAS